MLLRKSHNSIPNQKLKKEKEKLKELNLYYERRQERLRDEVKKEIVKLIN